MTFAADELLKSEDLFAERSALFYTPAENLPEAWVGEGPLDVTLPIPSPTHHEYLEVHGYRNPRMWVDLLQRATGKIRWRPNHPSVVRFTRADTVIHPWHVRTGIKAVLDALKVSTTGRSDGRLLHYFGAIVDDGPKYLSRLSFEQELVASPGEASLRIVVGVAESA